MYVVEVPSAGALNPERHMFDEFYLVIEGRGTTEVWREGETRPHTFEWQPGTLFMAPINTWHRLVNATNSPALVLAANNAPPIMNIFNSRSFVFDNSFDFGERFDSSADFFKANADVEAEAVRGRAAVRSNVFPDIINCELPLDNQRAPGYRRIQPYFHGYRATAGTGGFIAEYPSGRYSKAHYHQSGAVIVCLKGQGYTFNWPIRPRTTAVAERQGRRGAGPGVCGGWSGRGSAWRWQLVPPALQRQQGADADDQLLGWSHVKWRRDGHDDGEEVRAWNRLRHRRRRHDDSLPPGRPVRAASTMRSALQRLAARSVCRSRCTRARLKSGPIICIRRAREASRRAGP